MFEDNFLPLLELKPIFTKNEEVNSLLSTLLHTILVMKMLTKS